MPAQATPHRKRSRTSATVEGEEAVEEEDSVEGREGQGVDGDPKPFPNSKQLEERESQSSPGSRWGMHVHRCRFADWMPEPVHTLAALPPHLGGNKVAVARAGGDLELVSPGERWSVIARVPGLPGEHTQDIRALAWVGHRLFAVFALCLSLSLSPSLPNK